MGHYNLIKLNATSSTNDKVKTLIKSGKIGSGDIVWAEYQYKGRGQYKNKWISTRGKNLLITLYKEFKGLTIEQSSYINFVVSLSIIDTIDHYIPSKNYIKWPNDILSGRKKISGILIENTIKSNKINSTIIGAGINVNQIIFRNIPNVTSIKQLSKKDIPVDNVLKELIKNYKFYFSKINNKESLSKEYHQNLYGTDGCSFILNGKIHKGKVIEVIESGQIKVKINSKGIGKYNSGDIKIII